MADLSRDEIWDDSSLIDTWNHALQEYKKYHSINAKKDLQQTKKDDTTLSQDAKNKISSAHPSGDSLQDEEIANYEEEQMDQDTESKTEVPMENIEPEVDTNVAQSHRPTSSLPLPPAFAAMESNEALKKLMMSWYYAGYYTGLYEGQQKAAQGSSGAT